MGLRAISLLVGVDGGGRGVGHYQAFGLQAEKVECSGIVMEVTYEIHESYAYMLCYAYML